MCHFSSKGPIQIGKQMHVAHDVQKIKSLEPFKSIESLLSLRGSRFNGEFRSLAILQEPRMHVERQFAVFHKQLL